jgi:hypothetical protein
MCAYLLCFGSVVILHFVKTKHIYNMRMCVCMLFFSNQSYYPPSYVGVEGRNPEDQVQWETWRQGMQQMACLPNCYVKLSMFGYSVPDWWKVPLHANDDAAESILKRKALLANQIFSELYEMFGPDR